MRLVKIGERLQRVREIEIGNCSAIGRRGNIACVADRTSYSLLDVAERQRIPLFDIASSLDSDDEGEKLQTSLARDAKPASGKGNAKGAEENGRPDERDDANSGQPTVQGNEQSGPTATDLQVPPLQTSDAASFPPRLSPLEPPAPGPLEETRRPIYNSEPGTVGAPEAMPAAPPVEGPPRVASPRKARKEVQLHPHIASPSSEEFLLTTGTAPDEPGVGMFVNLDGDVVRGTLEFSRYPESLCIDISNMDELPSPRSTSGFTRDFVLAVVQKGAEEQPMKCLEIQSLDPSTDSSGLGKYWLDIEGETMPGVGLRVAASACETFNSEIADILRLSSLTIGYSVPEVARNGNEKHAKQRARRAQAEAQFVNRISTVQARILLWAKDSIWWALRNPLLVQLDVKLSAALSAKQQGRGQTTNLSMVEDILGQVRGLEGRTELEFLGLKYIRQKASLMLFMDLISRNFSDIMTYERDRRIVEGALSEGEIDPRIVLAILPVLYKEVIEGADGIWTQNGLKALFDAFVQQHDIYQPDDTIGSLDVDTLHLIKRYLQIWRRKKGFGSVSDEAQVFQSVDAALLHTLIILDRKSPRGPATSKTSLRAELNSVVDQGIDGFERAVALLESSNRFYVLSRLYQSRKMSSKVLETWRRIIEGERDDGGELVEGEQEVRRYLSRVNDSALVEEYGAWLASRNPKLGVLVFADSTSKIKFKPTHAIGVLRERAPNAVKDYLEHLVFDKNLPAYANDLITYYLDTVLTELSDSPETRDALLTSYSSYRALRSPKPTYIHFFADNAPPAAWCSARLRLLQLLGGSHGAASQYDVPSILARIAPFANELIPETIVLSGRKGKHNDAIHLLVQGLGDFDTAVSYCVLGGESTYSTLEAPHISGPTPSRDDQMGLFAHLLEEFLSIQDLGDRIAQTSELLQRFAGWFDVEHVSQSFRLHPASKLMNSCADAEHLCRSCR